MNYKQTRLVTTGLDNITPPPPPIYYSGLRNKNK